MQTAPTLESCQRLLIQCVAVRCATAFVWDPVGSLKFTRSWENYSPGRHTLLGEHVPRRHTIPGDTGSPERISKEICCPGSSKCHSLQDPVRRMKTRNI